MAMKTKPGPARSGSARLKDVANEAKVSTATISRYLNEPTSVSDAVRERVREAIDRLNWVPNPSARALASNRTRTVGIAIPTLDHQNFARLVEAMQGELMEGGLTTLVSCTSYDPSSTAIQVNTMIQRGVEVICLIGREHSAEVFGMLDRFDVRHLILYSSPVEGEKQAVIGFDNRTAFKDLTRRLLEMGHRRFGVISQDTIGNDRARERILGVHEALAERGIAVRPQHYVSGHWQLSDGRAGFRRIMAADDPPTAVVCGNDYLAIGALFEAASMGIDVPGAVSIVGFDDIEFAKHVSPALTTVRVPDAEIGILAGQYISALLRKETPTLPPVQPVSIIERGSAAPPQE